MTNDEGDEAGPGGEDFRFEISDFRDEADEAAGRETGAPRDETEAGTG
jgi:hypothetical protein